MIQRAITMHRVPGIEAGISRLVLLGARPLQPNIPGSSSILHDLFHVGCVQPMYKICSKLVAAFV